VLTIQLEQRLHGTVIIVIVCRDFLFSNAIRQATEDKNVKAIILRINSGGGSAVASDKIAREVLRAKENGTKVVASMLGVAASGGYFIAMNADKVLAQRTTITGSIGVFHGKFVLQKLMSKIGITWDDAKTGENSSIYSTNHLYTEEDEKRVEKMAEDIYVDFVSKAAKARGVEKDELEKYAQGRVWTGADAKANKLIDSFGGLYESVEIAKELAGIPATSGVQLIRYPKQVPFRQLLLGKQANSSDDVVGIQAQGSQNLSQLKLLSNLMLEVSDPRLKAMLTCIQHSLKGQSELLRIGAFEEIVISLMGGAKSSICH
jgi:protease-4